MKKWLIRIVIAVVILLVLVVVCVGLFLDSGIKKGVETFGPELTKVPIKLDAVKVSILSGSGSVKGLVVGNPEGYKATNAIQLGSASLALSPGSLLSDKIVIKHIRIESPVINVEGTPTKNNLTKILDNVEAATGGGETSTNAAPAEAGPSKKLEVDEFVLTGVKVNYTPPGLSQSIPLTIPDIKLTDLGTGPDGITAGDLTKKVISKITTDLVPVLAEEFKKLGKEVIGTASESAQKATGEAGKALKSVTDIFKKKE